MGIRKVCRVLPLCTVYCEFLNRLFQDFTIVCTPPPPFLLGGAGRGETGVEPITKFLEKWGWGLTGPQLLERVFFSVITKNSNREISPKNLVTFKR